MAADGFEILVLYAVMLVAAASAGLGLLLSPFLGPRKDYRMVQVLTRLALLAGGSLAVAAVVLLPDSRLLGHQHRAAQLTSADDWRKCAAAVARLRTEASWTDTSGTLLSTLAPEKADAFAVNREVWGEPEIISVHRPGELDTQVCFTWGGGFGHWGLLVYPDRLEPTAMKNIDSPQYFRCREWEKNVWIWISD